MHKINLLRKGVVSVFGSLNRNDSNPKANGILAQPITNGFRLIAIMTVFKKNWLIPIINARPKIQRQKSTVNKGLRRTASKTSLLVGHIGHPAPPKLAPDAGKQFMPHISFGINHLSLLDIQEGCVKYYDPSWDNMVHVLKLILFFAGVVLILSSLSEVLINRKGKD